MIDYLKGNYIVRFIWSRIPDKLKPGYSTYRKFRELIKETESLGRGDLEKYQLERLKVIVNYAWENTQGYRELWEEAGFYPAKLGSLKDIHLIPFVTKEMLRENPDRFSSKTIRNKRYVTTGGSTGTPLGFYKEIKNNIIENAFIHDVWSCQFADISGRDESTILKGARIAGVYEYDPIKGLLLSSYDIDLHNTQKYIGLIEKYKTAYMQAYPSAIYLMAKIIKENRLEFNYKFNFISLPSEPLYPFQRDLIQQVFKTRISHFYGATERVVLAANCEHDDRFHIYPQYGVTELLDNYGRGVKEGEVGEIVGTSFWNLATPFIRYKTKDFAELGAKYCEKCGKNYQLLNRIEGRLQDYIVARNKSLITVTGSIFGQHFSAFGHIRQMNLYQDKIGEVIVNVVPDSRFSEEDKLEIKNKMESAAHNRIDVHVNLIEKIKLTERGKLGFVEQKLNVIDFM